MTLELLHKPSMAELTSLGIGGSARALAKVRDEAGLDELSRFVESERSALLAIGEGSNMLAGDGNLNLTLIQIDRAQKKKLKFQITLSKFKQICDCLNCWQPLLKRASAAWKDLREFRDLSADLLR